jgi:hypothetical protein
MVSESSSIQDLIQGGEMKNFEALMKKLLLPLAAKLEANPQMAAIGASSVSRISFFELVKRLG